MPLQKQLVPVDFTGLLDTKTSTKLTIQGKLTVAENCTVNQRGDITMREGYKVLTSKVSGGAALAHGDLVATFANEVLVVNGHTAYSYAPDLGQLVSVGTAPGCAVTKQSVIRSGTTQLQQDFCSYGGVTLYAYLDSDTSFIHFTVKDEATGTVYQNDIVPPLNDSFCKCLVANGLLCMLYGNGSGGSKIHLLTVSPATPTTYTDTDTTITTVGGSGNRYDACAAGSNIFFAYQSNAASTPLYCTLLSTAGAIINTKVSSNWAPLFTACNVLNLGVSNTVGVWVKDATNGLTYWSFTYTAAAISAGGGTAVSIDGGARAKTAGMYHVTAVVTSASGAVNVYYDTLTSSYVTIFKATHDKDGGGIVLAAFAYGVRLAARCFSNVGLTSAPTDYYIPVAFVSTGTTSGITPPPVGNALALQNTFFLLSDGQAGNAIAKCCYGTLVTRTLALANNVTLPNAVTLGAVVSLVVEENTILTLASGQNISRTGISRLNFAFDQDLATLTPTAFANELFIPGGTLSSYDGANAVEHGFHLWPEGITIALNGPGGGAVLAAGTYQYVVVYEWIDNQGQRHQSAPSVAVQAVADGAKNPQVKAPFLTLTAKKNVTLVRYRTKTTGTTFYRVDGLTPVASGAADGPALATTPGNPVSNQLAPTSTLATFPDDNLNDATLGGNELLYTNGGNLANDGAPCCRFTTANQGRLLYSGFENPYEYRLSQQAVNNVGLQLNELLAGFVPTTNDGGITAQGAMDDKWVLFAATSIYWFAGDGPSSANSPGGWTTLARLPSDVGCVDARSVVLVPSGLMFKSKKGLYLLNRAMQVSYVGEAVAGFDALTITSATVVKNLQQVRFTTRCPDVLWSGLAPIANMPGPMLVYDYHYNQWGTYYNYTATGATTFQGIFTWLDPSGSLNQDTPNQYSDPAGKAIPMRVVTAWLKPGTIQGYVRVWRWLLLGTFGGPCTIAYSVGLNYREAWAWSGSITTDAAGLSSDIIQLRERMLTQKVEAVRFQFTVTPTGTPSSAIGISNLTLEVGLKRGAFKLPALQTVP